MRGLNTKVNQVYASVSSSEYDFIGFAETWLSDAVSDSELFPDSYSVIRKDRNFNRTNTTKGGGVLLAYKSDYVVQSIDLSIINQNFPFIDILGAKCTSLQTTLSIYVIYIPPHININEYEQFLELLSDVVVLQPNLLILGDFNAPNYCKNSIIDNQTRIINNFIEFSSTKQLNNINNNSDRILDLIISNLNCRVTRDSLPLVSEDIYHPSLRILVCFESIRKFKSNFSYSYNFKRAIFTGLYNAFSYIDWSFLDQFSDPNDMCKAFYDKLYYLFDLYVPKYRNSRRTYPVWYTPELIRNIKLKEFYYKNFKKFKLNYHYVEFSRLRKITKNQIANSFKFYLESVENSIINDTQNFWSYVQNKRGTSRIPGKINFNNNTFEDPNDIVNAYAQYFKSVFEKPKDIPYNHLNFPNLVNIDIHHITSNEILTSIKKLPNKPTSGRDMIPSFLVKDCANCIVTPLYKIFNLILSTQIFPDVWKIARICPVLKGGDGSEVTNYRPISILNNFAKVLEMSVYTSIFPQIKPLISNFQHGFMPCRSTVTNLIEFYEDVAEIVDKRGQVDVVYTDFSKAFDKIDHPTLLSKLRRLGISQNLLNLFSSYLENRLQTVFYNGYYSNYFKSTSGVPQGSNLGPLLFLIFINDIADNVDCKTLLFADDLKIYTAVSGYHDAANLQNQLNKLSQWCQKNNLLLNASKCKTCSFTRKTNPILYNYTINNVDLQRCEEIKDLGVTFDVKLDFVVHICNTIKAASKNLGFIVRNCQTFTNETALKTLYYSLVRSKLEYAAVVWNPHYEVHIAALEKVQRKFLKFLSFKREGLYPPRGFDNLVLLQRFNMEPLRLRRVNCGLIFLYKLLNNKIDSPSLLQKINFLVHNENSRNNSLFYTSAARTNLLLNSPIHFMCQNYNLLASDCDIHFDSLSEIVRISNLNYFLVLQTLN